MQAKSLDWERAVTVAQQLTAELPSRSGQLDPWFRTVVTHSSDQGTKMSPHPVKPASQKNNLPR